MNRLLGIVILGLGGLVTACATPYQPMGITGGYSETQLGENVYQVNFRGNGYTSRGRATDLSLLRSAELALENGYSHFIIVDSSQFSNQAIFTTPTTSHTTGSASSFGGSTTFRATTQTYGGQTYHFSKPETMNTVVFFKGKPEIDGLVFDAQFVYDSISQKYEIKTDEVPNELAEQAQ